MEVQIESGIADLKKGTAISIPRGILTLKNVVSEIPDEISTCKSIKADFAALEDWAHVFSSKASITATIAKNMALHHKRITADISAIESDEQAGNYFKVGEDIAQLMADGLGPVEKAALTVEEGEYGMPIQAPPLFAAGFLMEFISVNNLSEVTTCIDGFENDSAPLKLAIQDLLKKDVEGAIEAITSWVPTISPDVQDCLGAKDEIADIKAYVGQYVGNKKKLVSKVTRALAFHRKEIMGDVGTIKSDFEAGQYVPAGKLAADLVKLVLGPVEPDQLFFLY
jgi:hypothetical protein